MILSEVGARFAIPMSFSKVSEKDRKRDGSAVIASSAVRARFRESHVAFGLSRNKLRVKLAAEIKNGDTEILFRDVSRGDPLHMWKSRGGR